MKNWRTWMTLALMVLSLGFLTASDIECEDGEFEMDWPSFSHGCNDGCCDGGCGGYYYYESYDCGPWCGWF